MLGGGLPQQTRSVQPPHTSEVLPNASERYFQFAKNPEAPRRPPAGNHPAAQKASGIQLEGTSGSIGKVFQPQALHLHTTLIPLPSSVHFSRVRERHESRRVNLWGSTWADFNTVKFDDLDLAPASRIAPYQKKSFYFTTWPTRIKNRHL